MEASESQSPEPAAPEAPAPDVASSDSADSAAPSQEPVSEPPAPGAAPATLGPEAAVDAPAVDPAPASDPAPDPVPPVRVDNKSRRSDEDVLEGHFAVVTDGEHQGQVGAFVQVVEYGPDGYPDTVLIRFRDHNYHTDLASVPYADIRPADPYQGGR